MAIDHAVEDASRLVVAVVAKPHDRSRYLSRQPSRRIPVDGGHFAIATRDRDKSRGASDPTTAIRTAPNTGGQNATSTVLVASASIPAERGPTKASKWPAVYITAEYVEASLSSRAISGGSAIEATNAAAVPRPTMKTSGWTKSLMPRSNPSEPVTERVPAIT